MTTFTLFGQPSAPATVQSDNGAYTMGMQFTLSLSAALTGIWFFSPSGAGDLPSACGIFQVVGAGSGSIVSGTSNTSPTWSGAAGSGWVKCTYDGSVTLNASTKYKVAISHSGSSDFYGDSSHYWDSSGDGTNGLTSGIITAPNSAGADVGQDSYATAANLTYPATTFSAANYWIDVEVTSATNTLGAAVGAASAAPPSIPGANLTVFPDGVTSGGVSGPAFAGPSTSAAGGQFGPYEYPLITSSNTDTVINNNVWNGGSAPGWTQVLTAASPGLWGVVANMTNDTGAVISYPDVQQPYYERPLTYWASITSSWAETMNATSGSLCEAAYDIWLNQFANEVMIWVDTTPLQRATLNFDHLYGQVTIGGLLFDYYHGGGGAEIIYLLDTNQPSGTVDVLGVLHHAAANGLIPANSNLTTIEFGWEISTTNSLPQTFTLSSYSITETFQTGPAVGAGAAGEPYAGLPFINATAGPAIGQGATTPHPPGAVAGAAGIGFLSSTTEP